MDHEHTEHVAATPDDVYAAISNPENLARFVPQVTAIRSTDDDRRRRIERAAESGYRGWMQVDADGDGSRLTLFLHTIHDAEHDHEVASTLTRSGCS